MILIECDNDESVVRGLGFTRKQVEHHASKGRVAKALEKISGRAIAVVDEDPGAGFPGYFHQFQELEHLPDLHLRLLRHRREQKWIIELRPDLEPWLVEAAGNASVPLKSHYLPETASGLHLNPKSHADRLRSWTAAMLAAGCPRCLKLKEWLLASA